MLPAPLDHSFAIDGERYLLVEWDRGGDKRIKTDFAMNLVTMLPAPTNLQGAMLHGNIADPQAYSERVTAMSRHLSALIEALDGQSLWVEAIARECLREAPDLFWESVPATPGLNGAPTRRVTLDKVPRALWLKFSREVQVFRDQIFRAEQAEYAAASAPRPGESDALADAEDVPAVFRGRAQ